MLSEVFPNFSVSYLASFFVMLVSFAGYLKLRFTLRSSDNETLRHFKNFFGWFGVFQLFMAWPMFVPVVLSSVKLGAFYIFSHVFLYVSVAYLSLVPISIYRPEWKEKVFWLNIVAGGVISFVNIVYWTLPEIESNLLLYNVGAPVGPMIGVLVGLNMAVLAGGFFAKMAWDRSGEDRMKFVLLALGMFTMTVGGPLHDNASTFLMYVVADVLISVSILLILSGLYVSWVYSRLGLKE